MSAPMDIVVELRTHVPCDASDAADLYDRAANEIEALRAALASIELVCSTTPSEHIKVTIHTIASQARTALDGGREEAKGD